METKFVTRLLLTATLAGGLLLAIGAPAGAAPDNRSACDSRLQGARSRLDADIRSHGDHSKQADRDRARLEQARQWCKDHHADWDHDKYDR